MQESKANNLEPPLIVSVHGAIGQVVVEGGKREHILSLQAPVMVEQIAPMRTETQNNGLVWIVRYQIGPIGESVYLEQ